MQHFIQVTLNTFQSKALTNYKIVIFPSANDEEYKNQAKETVESPQSIITGKI